MWKKRRNKKRLTGPRFLNYYKSFLVENGIIHLKTDNDTLFSYTSRLVRHNRLKILMENRDLYQSEYLDDILTIKTTYEKQFLEEGSNINYISFRLKQGIIIADPPEDEE